MGESFRISGSHSKTERSKKRISTGTQKSFSRRNGLEDRSSGQEEATFISRNNLVCVSLNARSLVNKFDYFETWITAKNPDIVGVTESWTNDNILDSELVLLGYDMFS